MADVREILLKLLGKETISPAARKASDAVEDLGDSLEDTAKDARKLDAEIDAAEKSLRDLAVQYARTGDAADRIDLTKQIRKQQTELRRATKVRDLLPGDGQGVKLGGRLAVSIASGLSTAGGPISKALSNVFGTLPPQAQAGIGAGVVAAGTAAAPFIGGIIAGAVVGGVGIGGVIGGVAIAAKHPAVKAAAEQTGNILTDTLQQASIAFVPATIDALNVVKSEFRGMGEELKQIFSGAARFVRPLTAGLTGFVHNLLPGIQAIVAKGGPVINELASWGPKLGSLLTDVLRKWAAIAPEAARALSLLWTVFEAGVKATASTVGGLTMAFGALEKFSLLITGQPEKIAAMAASEAAATQRSQEWSKTLQDLTEGVGGFDDSISAAAERQKLLNASMEDAIKAAGGLTQAFDLLNGKALDLRATESAYQEAIDRATESIKENGKTLDLHTEKGRANDAALRNLIDATKNKAQATYNETLATRGQTEAQNRAAAVFKQGREQLIASAMQMGLSRDAARRLADQIAKIPTSWSTTVTARTDAASAALNRFASKLSQITGSHSVTLALGTSGGFRGFSAGGPVDGPGPKGVDSELAKLAPGEHVWTSREVDAAGGHARVEALRKAVLAGRPAPSMQTAAAVGMAPTVSRPATGPTGTVKVIVVGGDRDAVAYFRRMNQQYGF